MARRSFIAIVGHGPDLEREEGAASVLRSLGADVRTLDLWDDPPRLFHDDESKARAIVVEALDRPGLLNEITNVVAEHKVNIVAASIGTKPDGTASISATLKVTSLQQLSRVLARIERIRDITSVTREAR